MTTMAATGGMVRDDVRESTTWSIVLSVLMMISGLLAIAIPPVAGLAVTVMLGWLLIVTGALHLGFAWRGRGAAAIVGEIAVAVLYAALGFYMLAQPVAGLASLTLVIAAYFVAKGVLEGIIAIRTRPLAGSGWLLVDGVLAVVIAATIASAWPASSAWAVGVLVGIAMVCSGFTRLMASIAVRKLVV